jgi:hypothetical protein
MTHQEEASTITKRFVSRLLHDFRFMDDIDKDLVRQSTLPLPSPKLTTIKIKSPHPPLGPSLLIFAVPHVYETQAWESALRISPSPQVANRYCPTFPSLHWSAGAPPRLVAFVGTILNVCLLEWQSGEHKPILLHGESFTDTYEQIYDYVMTYWIQDNGTGERYRARFKCWVEDTPYVVIHSTLKYCCSHITQLVPELALVS